jgi:hypothetical protein
MFYLFLCVKNFSFKSTIQIWILTYLVVFSNFCGFFLVVSSSFENPTCFYLLLLKKYRLKIATHLNKVISLLTDVVLTITYCIEYQLHIKNPPKDKSNVVQWSNFRINTQKHLEKAKKHLTKHLLHIKHEFITNK